MNLTISQADLSETLTKVQNAVSQKNAREIFKNILFEVKDKILKISATNQEIYISSEIKVENSTDGSTTIPAKNFCL